MSFNSDEEINLADPEVKNGLVTRAFTDYSVNMNSEDFKDKLDEFIMEKPEVVAYAFRNEDGTRDSRSTVKLVKGSDFLEPVPMEQLETPDMSFIEKLFSYGKAHMDLESEGL